MPSFDIVSKTDMQEVGNALDGVTREITQRYDFKGSASEVALADDIITITADDDMKLRQIHELIATHLTRRKVDASALDYAEPQAASGNMVRQTVTIRQGIDKELAKKLTKAVKQSKLKVQASIQGDEVRIAGKKRDDLQDAISMFKEMDLDLPLQFVNFRD